jgi:hypothetical protein
VTRIQSEIRPNDRTASDVGRPANTPIGMRVSAKFLYGTEPKAGRRLLDVTSRGQRCPTLLLHYSRGRHSADSYCPRNPAQTILYRVFAEDLETFLGRQQQDDRSVPVAEDAWPTRRRILWTVYFLRVFPHVSVRQWVLSLPHVLRYRPAYAWLGDVKRWGLPCLAIRGSISYRSAGST